MEVLLTTKKLHLNDLIRMWGNDAGNRRETDLSPDPTCSSPQGGRGEPPQSPFVSINSEPVSNSPKKSPVFPSSLAWSPSERPGVATAYTCCGVAGPPAQSWPVLQAGLQV